MKTLGCLSLASLLDAGWRVLSNGGFSFAFSCDCSFQAGLRPTSHSLRSPGPANAFFPWPQPQSPATTRTPRLSSEHLGPDAAALATSQDLSFSTAEDESAISFKHVLLSLWYSSQQYHSKASPWASSSLSSPTHPSLMPLSTALFSHQLTSLARILSSSPWVVETAFSVVSLAVLTSNPSPTSRFMLCLDTPCGNSSEMCPRRLGQSLNLEALHGPGPASCPAMSTCIPARSFMSPEYTPLFLVPLTERLCLGIPAPPFSASGPQVGP